MLVGVRWGGASLTRRLAWILPSLEMGWRLAMRFVMTPSWMWTSDLLGWSSSLRRHPRVKKKRKPSLLGQFSKWRWKKRRLSVFRRVYWKIKRSHTQARPLHLMDALLPLAFAIRAATNCSTVPWSIQFLLFVKCKLEPFIPIFQPNTSQDVAQICPTEICPFFNRITVAAL